MRFRVVSYRNSRLGLYIDYSAADLRTSSEFAGGTICMEMIKETIGLVKNMADRNQTVCVFTQYHSEFEIG